MSGTPCKRLPRDHRDRFAAVAERAGEEGTIGVGELVRQLPERDSIERQALGIGLDADLARRAADDIGQADAVDLRQFMLQLLGDLLEAVVRPLAGLVRRGRKREDKDGDIVDAAPDDQRLGDALRQVADVGANFLVHPEASRCPGRSRPGTAQ